MEQFFWKQNAMPCEGHTEGRELGMAQMPWRLAIVICAVVYLDH